MKYLLTFILSLIPFLILSQEYPRYDIDEYGNKVVIITMDQAQNIDNNLELLELLELANSEIVNYDSICVRVIADKDRIIASQDMLISTMKESLSNKDDKIVSLHNEIKLYIKRVMTMQEQLDNQNESLKLKDKQIRNLKAKNIGFGIGGAAALVGLIIAIIFVVK